MNKEEIKKDFLKKYGYSTLFEFVDTCNDFKLYINILEDYFEKQSQLDIANKKLEQINEIVSSYGIQTIPSGLGECPVEVTAYELNNIYKLSIIGGE